MITNQKHGESTTCYLKSKGKEPAKWQSSIVYSNSFFSNYQYQNREKACHISKQECYTIITDSKGKGKTPPTQKKNKKKRQNVIREQTSKESRDIL